MNSYVPRARFACLLLAALASVALPLLTWSFFCGRSPHLSDVAQWVLPDEQSLASRLRSRFGNTSRAFFDADARIYSFSSDGPVVEQFVSPERPAGAAAAAARGSRRRPQRPLVRLVHQSWKTAELPKRMAAWSQTWRDCFPNWTHVLWTDADNERFVRDEYAWFLPRYLSFAKHIYRVDAVRYLYLHRFGGIYTEPPDSCNDQHKHSEQPVAHFPSSSHRILILLVCTVLLVSSGGACMEARVGTCLTRNVPP